MPHLLLGIWVSLATESFVLECRLLEHMIVDTLELGNICDTKTSGWCCTPDFIRLRLKLRTLRDFKVAKSIMVMTSTSLRQRFSFVISVAISTTPCPGPHTTTSHPSTPPPPCPSPQHLIIPPPHPPLIQPPPLLPLLPLPFPHAHLSRQITTLQEIWIYEEDLNRGERDEEEDTLGSEFCGAAGSCHGERMKGWEGVGLG